MAATMTPHPHVQSPVSNWRKCHLVSLPLSMDIKGSRFCLINWPHKWDYYQHIRHIGSIKKFTFALYFSNSLSKSKPTAGGANGQAGPSAWELAWWTIARLDGRGASGSLPRFHCLEGDDAPVHSVRRDGATSTVTVWPRARVKV